MKTRVKKFLVPELNRNYLRRVLLVALAAAIFFKYVCIPFRVSGNSMVPTYLNGSVNFCLTVPYWFSAPEPFDVVGVRLAGNHVMLLKRVVASENETVAFKDGRLFVNQKPIQEPYVNGPCDWNLPPRMVKPGYVYVVGDNRNISLERHQFGQTPVERVVGVPLW